MKKILSTLLILLLLIGCSESSDQNDELSIITTSYVTYDFVRAIAPNELVTLLVQPGESAHSFEPTAQDMVTINNSDLFIYTNDGMEPWVNSLIDDSVNKVDASKKITYIDSDHGHEDPHVWTSMRNAQLMVETIRDAIIEVDLEHKELYTNNADALIEKLEALDKEYASVFEQADIDTIVFLGHFGLNYLMNDYGVEYIALFESMSHESEPTIAQLTSIIDVIEEENLEVVFIEELASLNIVNTIEKETGVKTLELNSTHNISLEQYKNGLTFIEIQQQNIENLKVGLYR